MDGRRLPRALARTARAAWLRVLPRHFLLSAAPTARESGLAGEALVARELMLRGARVLARRLATSEAEVDLLASHGDALLVVEVKTGRAVRPRRPDGPPLWSARGPGQRLSRAQRRRLAAAARRLLRASPRHARARILLAEVLVDRSARAVACRWSEESGSEFIRGPPRVRSRKVPAYLPPTGGERILRTPMLRVLRHTLPLRKALLVLSETVILWVTVALGGTAHLFEPSPMLHRALAEEGYSLRSEAGLVCWISAFFVAVLCQLAITFNELYDFRVSVSKYDRARRFVGSMGSALALSLIAVLLAHVWRLQPVLDFPGLSLVGTVQMLVFLLLVGFAVLYSWRSLFHLMLQRANLNDRVLILGSGKAAHVLAQEIRLHPASGYEIAGILPEAVVDDGPPAFDPTETSTGDLVWSRYQVEASGVTERKGTDHADPISLLELCRAKQIDDVVVALADRRRKLPTTELLDCRLAGIRVEDSEGVFERVTGKIAVEALRPSYLIFNEGFARDRVSEVVKRMVDFTLALVGIVVAFVPMVLTAIAIRRDSPGPVLFAQERVGADGRPFTLFKFRSMRVDAEKLTGPVWAQEDDPRITRVGRFIRKARLDELPQLFNVLTGDMSLVGPRPERPHFVEELAAEIPYFRQRHIVKPGVTGWAQINYRYGNTLEDALQKLQYDLFYIKYQSVLFDLSIVFNTVKTVLLRKGT